MMVREGQETPLHFHFQKQEDIIVRAGGVLVLELFNSDENGGLRKDDVRVFTDEMEKTVKAGEPLHLSPGQSITLAPGLYHRFYGLRGKSSVLVGEVSDVNDDNADNRFFEPLGRFPAITEDEPPLYPLWKEIPG
jgi:D-lyxose ketol-isomerase